MKAKTTPEWQPPLVTPEMTPKRKAPKVEAPSGSGPILVDGLLHFSPLDLARYELAQAKVVIARQAVLLKKAEVVEAKHSFEEQVRRFNGDLVHAAQAQKVVEDELRQLQTELGASYNIDLSRITYDDQSGRISVLEEP